MGSPVLVLTKESHAKAVKVNIQDTMLNTGLRNIETIGHGRCIYETNELVAQMTNRRWMLIPLVLPWKKVSSFKPLQMQIVAGIQVIEVDNSMSMLLCFYFSSFSRTSQVQVQDLVLIYCWFNVLCQLYSDWAVSKNKPSDDELEWSTSYPIKVSYSQILGHFILLLSRS